jgi:Uma2 family endonuclease
MLLEEDLLVAQPVPVSGLEGLPLGDANRLAQGRPFELINGRMVFKMPDFEHARTQSLLNIELGSYLRANCLGQVLPELTYRFWPENQRESRQPDLSVILNENLKPGERYPTCAPDIAIEIISRDDVWSALFDKTAVYFEKGSHEVWLVDPYQRGVLVVTPETRFWEQEILERPELLPGFRVELKTIFSWSGAEANQK